MSEIRYEIFDTEAEVTGFSTDDTRELTFRIDGCADGFISLDGVAARLKEGVARIDKRLVSDGEIAPILILKDSRITLPRIKKAGVRITLARCDEEYLRAVSLRAHRLTRRISELERTIESLCERVYGTTVF